jgi:FKBP-type peptidyl-prolyl cis-trans isomerase
MNVPLCIKIPLRRLGYACLFLLAFTTQTIVVDSFAVHSRSSATAASFGVIGCPLPSSTVLGPVARNGLEFEDVEIGTGRSIFPGDTILCYYEGSFKKSGAGPFGQSSTVVFDRTEDGDPIEILIGRGQVIKGWDIGVLGDSGLDIPPMKVGGDRRLRIPSSLAYGEAGAGEVIPPGQDLEFQIAVLNAERKGGMSQDFKIAGYAAVVVAAACISIGAWWVAFKFL